MPTVHDGPGLSDEFKRMMDENVRFLRGDFVFHLRMMIIALLCPERVRRARLTRVSPLMWQCRTHGEGACEALLFEPIRALFRELFPGYSFRFALIGYSGEAGSCHWDIARSLRLILPLFPFFSCATGETREVQFFRGNRRKPNRGLRCVPEGVGLEAELPDENRRFVMAGDECYLASSLARGALRQGPARVEECVRHRACKMSADVCLVVDMTIEDPRLEVDFLPIFEKALTQVTLTQAWGRWFPPWGSRDVSFFEERSVYIARCFARKASLAGAGGFEGELFNKWKWAWEKLTEEELEAELETPSPTKTILDNLASLELAHLAEREDELEAARAGRRASRQARRQAIRRAIKRAIRRESDLDILLAELEDELEAARATAPVRRARPASRVRPAVDESDLDLLASAEVEAEHKAWWEDRLQMDPDDESDLDLLASAEVEAEHKAWWEDRLWKATGGRPSTRPV